MIINHLRVDAAWSGGGEVAIFWRKKTDRNTAAIRQLRNQQKCCAFFGYATPVLRHVESQNSTARYESAYGT